MLDRNSSIPLHTQMEELIKTHLNDGSWGCGDLIPSENELSREFGVSRMTVRNVITSLVHEGLLFRIPGKGTYVSEQKIQAKSLSYAGIREQLEKMGYEVSTKLLKAPEEVGTEKLCRIFGLPSKTLFVKLIRLRFIKGIPLSIHTSFVPAVWCPDLLEKDLENVQLCHLLNSEYNLQQIRTEETLESVAATAEEAAMLQIKAGHPLLLLTDTIYGEGNRPYEYAKVIFRGDRIKLSFEFS